MKQGNREKKTERRETEGRRQRGGRKEGTRERDVKALPTDKSNLPTIINTPKGSVC